MALRIFKLEKQVTDTILLKKEIQDCEYIKKIAYKMQSNLDTYIENVLKLLKYRAQITPLIPINDSIIDEERLVCSHALKSDFSKEGKLIKLGMADVYLDSGASKPKDHMEAAMDHYDPEFRRYSKVPLDILYMFPIGDYFKVEVVYSRNAFADGQS